MHTWKYLTSKDQSQFHWKKKRKKQMRYTRHGTMKPFNMKFVFLINFMKTNGKMHILYRYIYSLSYKALLYLNFFTCVSQFSHFQHHGQSSFISSHVSVSAILLLFLFLFYHLFPQFLVNFILFFTQCQLFFIFLSMSLLCSSNNTTDYVSLGQFAMFCVLFQSFSIQKKVLAPLVSKFWNFLDQSSYSMYTAGI